MIARPDSLHHPTVCCLYHRDSGRNAISMANYRYQSLPHEDSIRILVLHPSSSESDPITCTIRHTRLSDASLKYEGLSYTWGDITQKQAIHVDESELELLIGRNCHDALRHLRHQSRGRSLWIDAICINQEDLEERAQQVRNMNNIYKLSSDTIVYLGESTPGSHGLFEELNAREKTAVKTGVFHSGVFNSGGTRRYPDILLKPDDVVTREFEILLQRPWFKRVWVLQEVCWERSVIFMCGSDSVTFDALPHWPPSDIEALVYDRWGPPLPPELIRFAPKEALTSQFTLWHQLYRSRECLASDDRDRVFALKSLLGKQHSDIDFLINYNQSVEQCFIQVARYLMEALGARILAAIRHPHNRKMPSWVPDWSQNSSLEYLFFDPEESRFGAQDSPTQSNLKPYFNQNQKICSLPDGIDGFVLEMEVTGCQYGKVVDSSEDFIFYNMEDAAWQMKELYNSAAPLKGLIIEEDKKGFHQTSRRLGTKVHHGTYVTISQMKLALTQQTAMSLMDGQMLHLHLCRAHTDELVSISIFFHEIVFVLIYIKDEEGFTPRVVNDFYKSLNQCKIALMENGELVTVPASVQYSDVVCFISGTASPCALRMDLHGTWRLISGDCYVFIKSYHGLFPYGFRPHGFRCDRYVTDHASQVEVFKIR
jgi:hypothetical protein